MKTMDISSYLPLILGAIIGLTTWLVWLTQGSAPSPKPDANRAEDALQPRPRPVRARAQRSLQPEDVVMTGMRDLRSPTTTLANEAGVATSEAEAPTPKLSPNVTWFKHDS